MCDVSPSFNIEGSKCPVRCKIHRADGMVNVTSKRCAAAKCNRFPGYNDPGKSTGQFCKEHMREGMVQVSGTYTAKAKSVGETASREQNVA